MKSRLVSIAFALGFLSLALFLLAGFRSTDLVKMTTVLYDGTLGGTPDSQGFSYLALGATAAQSFAGGVTTLDTMGDQGDQAGYIGQEVPVLDRELGYSAIITIQMLQEAHASQHRAGFSMIILSEDLLGIELAFWTDAIWAQEGGVDKLFTHAEGAAYDTTADQITYELQVLGDTYTLLANDEMILTGPLRDYTAFEGLLDPYQTPNLVFMGDNTSRARTEVDIVYMALETTAEPTSTPTATATSSKTPTLTPSPTATATTTPQPSATLAPATHTPVPPTPTPEPKRGPFWWLPCIGG